MAIVKPWVKGWREFGKTSANFADLVVNRCVDTRKLCMRHMMMGGHGERTRPAQREAIALSLVTDAAVCRADGSLAAALASPVYSD